MDSQRLAQLDLSVKLVEEIYGEQEEAKHLVELLSIEFPGDNFSEEEVHEWSSLVYEQQEKAILYQEFALGGYGFA
jgi:hypothetical protein